MTTYEEMLKEARKKLPESNLAKERFEIPKVKGYVEGNKTIISNFHQIVSLLNRDAEMFLKFIQKELATPAMISDDKMILGRKIGAGMINKKIEQFANDYVLCRECGKPDTQLIKEDRVMFIKCMACGAKHPVVVKI